MEIRRDELPRGDGAGRSACRAGEPGELDRRSRFGKGERLSGPSRPDFPAWRAFGPGASRLHGWAAPREALPRTALRIVEGQGVNWAEHLLRLQRGALELGTGAGWLPELVPGIRAWISGAGTAVCRMQLFPDAISVRLESPLARPSSYGLLAVPHPLGDLRGNRKAPHKGLLGDWDLKTRAEAQARQADDALLLWPDGTIAETTLAAVGLQLGDRLLLPPAEGRVESITEALELPRWAGSHGLTVETRPIHLEEVSAGQLWCMNAVRGLWQAEVVRL